MYKMCSMYKMCKHFTANASSVCQLDYMYSISHVTVMTIVEFNQQ